MNRREPAKPADGIVVTLVDYDYVDLSAHEPPEVGSRVELWVDDDTALPVIAYLEDNTPIGVMPIALGVALAEQFLWLGRDLACAVDASGVSSSGEVWVQVRIVGVIANDPRQAAIRTIAEPLLGGGSHG